MIGQQVLGIALAFTISVILFVAALHKLRDVPIFEAQVGMYDLLPTTAIRGMVLALPLVELVCAGALLLPQTRSVASLASALLFAIYGSAMAINLARGRFDLDCGCGAEVHIISPALVVRNAIYAGAGLIASRAISPTLPDYLVGTMLAALLCLIIAIIQRILIISSNIRSVSSHQNRFGEHHS